jgi:hypothetical protein
MKSTRVMWWERLGWMVSDGFVECVGLEYIVDSIAELAFRQAQDISGQQYGRVVPHVRAYAELCWWHTEMVCGGKLKS